MNTIIELREAAYKAAEDFSKREDLNGTVDGLGVDDFSRQEYLKFKTSLDGIETSIVADPLEFSRWNGHFADGYTK